MNLKKPIDVLIAESAESQSKMAKQVSFLIDQIAQAKDKEN